MISSSANMNVNIWFAEFRTRFVKMDNFQPCEFLKIIQSFHKHVDDNFEQPSIMLLKLRSCQLRAVKWMVDRETKNELIKIDGSPFSGGILADEMGLGKTVEMLTCIASNPAPLEKSVPSASDENIHIECYCIETPPNSTLVICAVCNKGQHAECVHFLPKPFQEVPYLCATCWALNEKLQCKATLVVVPLSIVNQWTNEIEKHIAKPGLKVLLYNGVHSDGYIQPFTFNEYDVVITSYTNLSKDLNYFGDSVNQTINTRLRRSKKYNYPRSPLTSIKWWRICLDEAQTVESLNCKASEITSCLQSVHRWAMSGTPIHNSMTDLKGICKFLQVKLNYKLEEFVHGNNISNDIIEWFSKLIWRNTIEDVQHELKIPTLINEYHWLTFSPIEKHFYLGQHDNCASIFSNAVTRLFPNLNIPIKSVDRKNVYQIIAPLFKLRQACLHPQAVNGQLFSKKRTMTMTMEKLMDVMIKKCRVECNDILRSLVSQHNALAGLYLIRREVPMAISHYRTVLTLLDKYKERDLKIDSCQKIHVMYNLDSILSECKNTNTPTTHDSYDLTLKQDMEQLENEYLGASKQNIEITQKTVTLYSVKIAKLLEDKTLAYSDWWSDMLDWIFSPCDFLSKVKIDLDNYHVPGVPNIANKLKTRSDVFTVLSIWLTDLNTARVDTLATLNTLAGTSMNDLVEKALLCHLRVKSKKGLSNNRCLLCKVENQLKVYETLLFSVSNKPKTTETDTTDENEENTYESTSKGLWKMSQKELLLMKLFQYGQAKIINKNCLKDAAEHMKVLELVRKEFRYLRLLWTHLSDSLSAHDEIVMAKSRLRLGESGQDEHTEYGPPKKKTKKDNENDVIMEQYVDHNMAVLGLEIPNTVVILEKKIGTLLYLEKLKKEKENSTGNEPEPCPICQLDIDDVWAVLQCGHSVCSQCLASMCKHMDKKEIVCPMCRSNSLTESVAYVRTRCDDQMSSNTVIKGSFSTKVENITSKLMELIKEDPKVKVLIFSTWDKILSLIGEALEHNSVNYRTLKPGNKYNKTLTDFKTDDKINALLMKLCVGSKGLNLTEATRIFFVEPLINNNDELQAIGRVHRMGQARTTYVHHFIIRDSIEENIANVFSSGNKVDHWSNITLAQMLQVFERSSSYENIEN
ncbi:Hypothetical protein CINCED_3A019573 [Cinara cedri]|uniref:E3 ubiquitin-protein ligase SHPRH n=1 Tax=Cinara cedri TaxID=506608 RepID=A0A5E4MG46_9HEMI|nr:Hypothetical protein CINCED_3A019573 [Cinara cedri]